MAEAVRPASRHLGRPSWSRRVDDPTLVLVVEDEPDLAFVVRLCLEGHGYSVVVVGSGEEALTRLADDARATDVVLLDVMLPGIDGWQVLHHVRTRMEDRSVPVIMTSVLDPYDTRDEAMTRCADAFISKPFSAAALVKVVERVLGQTATACANEPHGVHDEA